jgi:glycosyltransferase involved in cell wall biosynthesis
VSPRGTDATSDARRLLVITYYFGPDGPVGGLRWLGITKYLARMGWKISVVTAVPATGNEASIGPDVEVCPRLWTLSDGWRLFRRLALRPSLGGFAKASGVANPSAPSGLLRRLGREVGAFLTFPDESRGWMLRAALRTRSVMRRFRPHVVVSSGPPHSAHLVAALATIGSAVPWWIDLRDPWAGPLEKIWESDRMLGSRLFRIVAPRVERFAFRAATGIITNTRQLGDALTVRYPDVPVVCVPNGVDPERLPPPARDRYPGLGIAYTGWLYAGRDLGPVVQALRLFLEQNPEAAGSGAKLRVAGQADARHGRAFYSAVAAAGMEPYVEVLGPLPRAEALTLVSRSRLAIVLAQEQELQIPAKLYESVAMGIPTLVVAPPDSAAAIEGNRVGAVVRDAADVDGIACLLERLSRDGSRERPCPVPITYDALAPAVDELFRKSYTPDDAGRRRVW